MTDFHGWPHLMVAGFDCDPKPLSNIEVVYKFLKSIPEKIGMKMLGLPLIFPVMPEDHPDTGVSGIVVIATSHISIHTFPKGQWDGAKHEPRKVRQRTQTPFFTLDCYSCKDFDSHLIIDECKKVFGAKRMEVSLVYRLREDAELIEVEQPERNQNENTHSRPRNTVSTGRNIKSKA